MKPSTAQRSWLALIVCALLFKLTYLVQYLELPFLYGPMFDSAIYLEQASSVLAGRFGDPTLLGFSPAYGYFLALTDGGSHHGVPVLWQLLFGLFNLALIRRITARWFGEPAGLLSAFLYLAYGLLAFYETKLMSETLGMTLLLGAIDGLTSTRFARSEPLPCVATGAALAFATLARASFVPMLPWFTLAACLPWGFSDPLANAGIRARLPRAAWLTLGLVAILSLNGAWTKLHSGLFVPVILVSSTIARATQLGEWHGKLSALGETSERELDAWNVVHQARAQLHRSRAGLPETPAERAGLLGGMDLGGYLRGIPSKLWITVSDTETTFDYGYYGERSEVSAYRASFVSFGMLLSLAALGLLLSVHDRKIGALWPLAPIVIGVLLTVTLVHPSSRYRLPLVIALLPLASHALVRAPQIVRLWPRLVACAYVVLAIGYFAWATLSYRLGYPAMWELRVAEAAVIAGDREEAFRRLDRAHAMAPSDPPIVERARYVASMLGSRPRSNRR